MAAASGTAADPPEQLWLDVARPIHPRPPRARRGGMLRGQGAEAASDRQMELRMAARPCGQAAEVRTGGIATGLAAAVPPSAAAPRPPAPEPPATERRPCFVSWLLAQGKGSDTVAALAKAARGDRLFPRRGDIDAVRAWFGAAGADGDAYAALEDAERAYGRAA